MFHGEISLNCVSAAMSEFCEWGNLSEYLRHVQWKDIFKLHTSAATSEFCEWVHVGTYAYIPHCEYQDMPHSCPWFSAACTAAIVHGNHFFVFTNRINLLDLKESLGKLVIIAKYFLNQTCIC